MKPQLDLFTAPANASAEGRYCVAVTRGQRHFAISRDHRWHNAEAAQTWLDKNRKRWPEGAHVRLVCELDDNQTRASINLSSS